MSTEKTPTQPNDAVPVYYHTVVTGAQQATSGRVTTLSTVEGCFQRWEELALANSTNHDKGKEVRFLNEEGQITDNVRTAVGVVVNNIESSQAALFFRERFCQPESTYERPKSEPRRLSDLPEFAHRPPLMSNFQAHQVATGGGYIGDNMRFQANKL